MSKILFILFAIAVDPILYIIDDNDMGLQIVSKCLDFSSLSKQVMTYFLSDIDQLQVNLRGESQGQMRDEVKGEMSIGGSEEKVEVMLEEFIYILVHRHSN